MNKLIVLLVLVGSVGCSSLVDKVEKEKNDGVKTVAIVGLTFDREKPNDALGIVSRLLGGGAKVNQMTYVAPVSDSYADAVYSLVSKRMQDRMHVEVMAQNKVASNSLIQNIYKEKDKAIQLGGAPLSENFERLEASGIPMYFYIQQKEKSEIDKLCNELKVDAIVFIHATSNLDKPGVWTLGIGKMGSVSDVSIMMYNKKAQDFTLVLNQRGDLFKFGDTSFAGYDQGKEVQTKSYQSFESALNQLIERI